MASRNWLIAIIAVLIGLAAVVVANSWFSGMEDKQQSARTETNTTRIVVATQPLEFGTKLTAQNIRLQDWPAASVPQGAFRTIEDVLRENRAAVRPIVVGEPILADKVTGSGGRATLAALLPEGMRAFSIPVNALHGVAGFVLPGTMVDVILTRKIPGEGTTNEDYRSDVVLTNVQVLAIDQLSNDRADKPRVGRTATVAVTLLDAQRLTLATKMGTLSLAMRRVETAAGATNPNLAIAEAGGATITGRQLGGPRLYVVARDRGERAAAPAQARAPAPVFMPAAPAQARVGPAVTGVPNGPTMTIFRGAEPTVYPVGTTGGR